MELSEFVEEVLLGISEAVERAKLKAQHAIAPGKLIAVGEGDEILKEPQYIEFDLATTVSETVGQQKGGGGKISVVGICLSVDGKKEDHTIKELVNRIKFRVPIYFQSRNSFRFPEK